MSNFEREVGNVIRALRAAGNSGGEAPLNNPRIDLGRVGFAVVKPWLGENKSLEELVQQLRSARMAVIAGDMNAAHAHIEDVLESLDDAIAGRAGPKPSVRSIRGYIAEAGYAITKSDSRRAVSALDEALRALE